MEKQVVDLKPHFLNKKLYGEEVLPQEFLDSVKEKGVLVPLAVKQDGTIISGHRRWRAARAANIETVPVNIISFDNELDEREAVIDFNRQRKKTFSQKMSEAEELEKIERERAKKRQGTRTDLTSAKCVTEVKKPNRATDKVAEKTGIGSGRTYDRAKKVWEAAKSGDKKARKEVEKIDKGQTTIHSAYKKIKQQQPVSDPPPLPEGVYDVIYADPPWKYNFSEASMRAIENQYSTMSLEDIKSMEIPAADNAVLLLWGTAPKLEEALSVLNAWGFTYKTCAVWDKEKMGPGYWFRIQHELLLVGSKGDFSPPKEKNRYRSCFRKPREGHSEKPQEVYKMIEDMFPGHKYLELFARNKRSGWTSWGDEA